MQSPLTPGMQQYNHATHAHTLHVYTLTQLDDSFGRYYSESERVSDRVVAGGGGGIDYHDLYCLLWCLTRADDARHEWAAAAAAPSYYYYYYYYHPYFVRPPRPCNRNAEAVAAAAARILFF